MKGWFVLFVFMMMIGTAHAQCDTPPGEAGTQIYNADHNVMQYCNGTRWVAMGSTSEEDPTIGTIMAEGWCKSDGEMINCDHVEPASGPPPAAISESTSVNCTATVIPLSLSCTATCPDGFFRSGCFATLGIAQPVGDRACFCATPDLQCTAFCLK